VEEGRPPSSYTIERKSKALCLEKKNNLISERERGRGGKPKGKVLDRVGFWLGVTAETIEGDLTNGEVGKSTCRKEWGECDSVR